MHDGQMSLDGKSLTPVHDRIYGRPSACYGAPDTTPERTPSPPSPSVRESDRPEPLASSAVDINDRDSVARFRGHQRRAIELLASIEHQIAGFVNVASVIWLAAAYSALLVVFLNLVMILLPAS